MEIEGTDGSKSQIKPGQTREFGRGQGFVSNDKTVSRRHVSFSLHQSDHSNGSRLHFQVVGKNPIWLQTGKNNEVKAFRSSEKGEIESGDMFCMSAENPVWFSLKKTESDGGDVKDKENENVERELGLETELAQNLQSGSGSKGVEELEHESIDISDIDPVKEFEFVVIGHEFDCYPKKMIRDIKNWEWFLEERGEDNEDDESEEKKVKRGGRRKRKKGEENDDDEWTGESEDDQEVITKSRNVQRPKYTTRSKDRDKLSKDTTASKSKSTTGMKTRNVDDEDVEDENEDEDDGTLGGFIVTDKESEQEEETDGEEEEELDDEFDEEDSEL